MSQENVDLARRGFEALNDRGVDGLLPFLHPEVEWISIRGFLPDAQDYYGHEGVLQWFEKMASEFEDPSWEALDIIDGGEGLVVAVRARAIGKTSGVPVELEYFHTVAVRQGKAMRVETYLQRGQALEAAGLSE